MRISTRKRRRSTLRTTGSSRVLLDRSSRNNTLMTERRSVRPSLSATDMSKHLTVMPEKSSLQIYLSSSLPSLGARARHPSSSVHTRRKVEKAKDLSLRNLVNSNRLREIKKKSQNSSYRRKQSVTTLKMNRRSLPWI